MKNIIKYTVSILIFSLVKLLENIFNYKFKFAFIYSSRLGHLCRALDLISTNKNLYFIINHEKKVSNDYILNDLIKKRKVFSIFFATEKLISILNNFNFTKNLVFDFNYFESNFHKYYISPPPNIILKKDDLDFYNFRKKKNLLGNYVNFHNRDNLYLDKNNINDNNYHSFRDFDFQDYSKAINYLLKKYTVIRTGSKHINYKNKDLNFYDFTNENYNEKDLIFFYKYAKYNIMSFDGTTILAGLFRKKSLYVNLIPFNLDIICNLNPGSIILPKKIFSKELDRCLTFSEMNSLKLNVHTARKILSENNLHVINNSPNEILDGVMEMEKIHTNGYDFDKIEKDIINQFWNIFDKKSPDKINFYRTELKIQISPKFLLNNIDMIN